MNKVKRSVSERIADLRFRFGEKTSAGCQQSAQSNIATSIAHNNAAAAAAASNIDARAASDEVSVEDEETIADDDSQFQVEKYNEADQIMATTTTPNEIIGSKCRTLPRGFRYSLIGPQSSDNKISDENEAVEVLMRGRKLSALSPCRVKEENLTREELTQRRIMLNQQLQSVLHSATERTARRRLQYHSHFEQDSKLVPADEKDASASAVKPKNQSGVKEAQLSSEQPTQVHYADLVVNDVVKAESSPFSCSELPAIDLVKCQVGVHRSETYWSAACSGSNHPTMSLRAKRWASTMKQLSYMRDANNVDSGASNRERKASTTFSDSSEKPLLSLDAECISYSYNNRSPSQSFSLERASSNNLIKNNEDVSKYVYVYRPVLYYKFHL